MKRSINAWSVPAETGFRDMFRALSAAGFDGIELNIDGENGGAHSLSLEMKPDELAEIKALSEEYSLPVHSVSTSLYGASLGSQNARENDFGKRLLLTQMDFAQRLGAQAILAVPGGITPDNSVKAARERAMETILSIKSEIEERPVAVGLENVWNYFFAGPLDMVQFIDGLAIKNVGAYFDAGNVAIFSEPWHWIELLGGRIIRLHVKDFLRTGWNAGVFVNLLEGSIDWKRTLDALRAAGYDGYVTAELCATPLAPDFLYRITADALNTMLAL